jgi:hypothetical protein
MPGVDGYNVLEIVKWDCELRDRQVIARAVPGDQEAMAAAERLQQVISQLVLRGRSSGASSMAARGRQRSPVSLLPVTGPITLGSRVARRICSGCIYGCSLL